MAKGMVQNKMERNAFIVNFQINTNNGRQSSKEEGMEMAFL
jgi:hypothetical protein